MNTALDNYISSIPVEVNASKYLNQSISLDTHNILSTQKVANYLQSFIMLRKNNKNMTSAIVKWKEDITYVLNYRKTNRNIRINSLTVR